MIIIDCRQVKTDINEYIVESIKDIKGPRQYSYDLPDKIIMTKQQRKQLKSIEFDVNDLVFRPEIITKDELNINS